MPLGGPIAPPQTGGTESKPTGPPPVVPPPEKEGPDISALAGLESAMRGTNGADLDMPLPGLLRALGNRLYPDEGLVLPRKAY